MKDSSQLLDLLSAADSGDLEPTKAAAGRVAIYPEVSPRNSCLVYYTHLCVSIYPQLLC